MSFPGELHRRPVAQRGVRPTLVVVSPPSLDFFLRVLEGGEPVLVQALLLSPSVERLGIGIVARFARPDEVELHLVPVRPAIERPRGKFGTVVQPDFPGYSSGSSHLVQDPHDVASGQALADLDRKTLPTKVID